MKRLDFIRQNSKTSLRAFRLAIFLLAGTGLLHAADPEYAKSPARGLAIYKPHDSASDKTAMLIEYRSFTARERVSYLITANGSRLAGPDKTAKAPEKSEAAGTAEPDPLDLKGNLKKIQEFYRTSQILEEAQ